MYRSIASNVMNKQEKRRLELRLRKLAYKARKLYLAEKAAGNEAKAHEAYAYYQACIHAKICGTYAIENDLI